MGWLKASGVWVAGAYHAFAMLLSRDAEKQALKQRIVLPAVGSSTASRPRGVEHPLDELRRLARREELLQPALDRVNRALVRRT